MCRLNYVLWLQDIVKFTCSSNTVRGLDMCAMLFLVKFNETNATQWHRGFGDLPIVGLPS